MNVEPRTVDITHGHLFCGIGGGAKGFNRARAVVGNVTARFRCVGGIDVDPGAIADFGRLTGVPGTVLDLFSREQYIAFHGHEPPAGWRAATPADIRRGWGGERPNIGFGSAPCKGFSGLLSESKSKSDKYTALNQLALRGLWLALEAYKDDPLDFWLWENVPRIATRGRAVLDQMIALLDSYGYAVAETTHDCGELGGLAQSRKRFLLVARHREKVPPFLYEPVKRRVRGVGEVIGRLPVPTAEAVLPMHRLPMLQWQTWVRLAFVEAGSDWRSLNRLRVEGGVLRDFALVPAAEWNNGALGVRRWDDPAGTVTSRGTPTCGAFSVADPRINGHEKSVQMGVGHFDQPAAVIKGDVSVGTGRYAIADPRYGDGGLGEHRGKMRVEGWDEPAHTVTGSDRVGSGAMSVADPRLRPDENRHRAYGVLRPDDTAPTIINARAPGQGAFSVADPRLSEAARWEDGRRGLGVLGWENASGTVTSQAGPGKGAFSIADPRPAGPPKFNNVFRIVPFESPSPAIAGPGGSGGGLCVADPRPGYKDTAHRNKFAVQEWNGPSGTVTGADHITGGALSVADPRVDELRNGGLGVKEWDEHAGVVAGESHPTNGAFAVADPRVGLKRDASAAFQDAGGAYGVLPWDARANTVVAAASHDNGKWTIADPREPQGSAGRIVLPAPTDRLVAVIQALDGTYHRPFTTLELAAIQSLVDVDEVLELEGKSDSAWRERIGNAVPPDAAEAIAGVMGTTLLLAWAGETFVLSATPVWVQPVAIALAVDQRFRESEWTR